MLNVKTAADAALPARLPACPPDSLEVVCLTVAADRFLSPT